MMQMLGGGEEVAVAEGEEVGAIQREEGEAPVKFGEFVEVEGEQEDAVDEAVLLRRKTVMQHGAFIEAGTEGGHCRRKRLMT